MSFSNIPIRKNGDIVTAAWWNILRQYGVALGSNVSDLKDFTSFGETTTISLSNDTIHDIATLDPSMGHFLKIEYWGYVRTDDYPDFDHPFQGVFRTRYLENTVSANWVSGENEMWANKHNIIVEQIPIPDLKVVTFDIANFDSGKFSYRIIREPQEV